MREQKQSPTLQASLLNALDRHFVGCAAVAAVAAVAGQAEHAQAAVIYSGTQNIAVSYGAPGLYLNLVTKAHSTTGIVTGWDINPYVHTPNFFIYTPTSGQLVKSSTASGGGDVADLATGATISSSSTYVTTSAAFMTSNTVPADWGAATNGFVGIKFTEPGVNSGNTMYGWIHISKGAGVPTAAPTGITIIDWAYDNTGAAITVPEPSSLALLATGAIGLLARRGQAKLRRPNA